MNQNEIKPEQKTGIAVLTDHGFKIERVSNTTPGRMKTYHYHNDYELYYLYSGERYYFIKDKTYHVKRGNLVLIKPYDIHFTSSNPKSSYDRCLVTFKKSFIREIAASLGEVDLFSIFDKDVHLVQLSFAEQSFVETLLASLINENKTKADGYEEFSKTAIVQILLIASRHIKDAIGATAGAASAAHKTISEVAAYINNCYNEEITLETISERFFISQCYFSRTFKRVTGVSFSEYLTGVRIKEAERLLAKSDMPIADICVAVGFNSMTHFGRSFKNITGMSPMAFRRTRKKA